MSDLNLLLQVGNRSSNNSYEYELVFKGQTVEMKDGYVRSGLWEETEFNIVSSILYERVSVYPIIKLTEVGNVFINYALDFSNSFKKFYLRDFELNKESFESDKEKIRLRFYLFANLRDWTHLWSGSEHIDAFFHFLKQRSLRDFNMHIFFDKEEATEPYEVQHRVTFIPFDCEVPLNKVVDECIKVFTEAHDQVLDEFQSSLTSYSLTEQFNFPSEVKTACEQYLLYFAEFLKDVGIEVTTNITEKDQDVILTIIPENKKDALEKIGYLLNLYLHLPNGTLVNDYQLNAEMGIQAQKLYGQIQQLESQLSLTNAENQFLQLTVDSLKRDLKRYDSQILLESKANKNKDKEPLIGNRDNAIVSLTEISFWGVNVNLASLLRELKKAVRGD